MALRLFSLAMTLAKATREWSSTATCTNSQPTPAAVALTLAVAGDAVADPVEATEFFDVDMDHLAGLVALVTPHRHGRLKGIDAVETQPLENAADSSRRDRKLGSDLLSGAAGSTQRLDLLDDRLGRGLAQPMRPRAAIA